MQPAALRDLGPQKHDNGGGVSAIGGDGVERGQSGNSAKGTNACVSPSTRTQGNAQSITDEDVSSASPNHADNLEVKAESEMRRFAARGPGGKPAVGKPVTPISRQEENPQPIQGQTPPSKPIQEQTPQPPQEQPGTAQPPQEQPGTAQPSQGQTFQPAREQTSRPPEQQTPRTTGGQKSPAKEPKRRRPPATTATSATTAG